MKLSFNLLNKRWIPCVQLDGKPTHMGIRRLLAQSHELREVAGPSPLITAAIYRLLLVILHRVFGPENRSAWGRLWQAKAWDMEPLDAYLEQWAHRFDLFDNERPFYQIADDRVRQKSVISMVPHLASGNNATLFDHSTEETGAALTPAQAAQALLVAQSFGLAGLSGLSEKFTDAPCARGIYFLVQGHTLFETLTLNLIRYSGDVERPIPTGSADKPVWEMEDPFAGNRQVPLGYLDYLTWQNRRVLLKPEQDAQGIVVRQMTVAPGMRFDSNLVREGVLSDPMNCYRKDEKRGCLVLRFREGRSLWRDSSALFQVKRANNHVPPYVFSWLSGLVGEHLEESQIFRFMALGMASKQAKVDFYRQENMPLPLLYLEKPELVGQLGDALQIAEDVGRKLWGAAQRIAALLIPPADEEEGRLTPNKKKDVKKLITQWGIERHYWGELEIHYYILLETLPEGRDQALIRWRKVLQDAAWSALAHAETLAGSSTNGLRAAVRGRDRLAYGLSQVFPPETEKEVNA
jgi:CRISPR system Cascade subunit CasA